MIASDDDIRKAFQIAGKIESIEITRVPETAFGRIEYNHPLEAAQAVRIYNEQIFFGRKLSVVPCSSHAYTDALPKGVESIGDGFGVGGAKANALV